MATIFDSHKNFAISTLTGGTALGGTANGTFIVSNAPFCNQASIFCEFSLKGNPRIKKLYESSFL